MERALKKRLYVYTIGMFLATVVVVSVITIYYEYRAILQKLFLTQISIPPFQVRGANVRFTKNN